MGIGKSQEVILEAQRDKKKVHCATLMDIRHLKNAELEPKYQKYKGKGVLRGDSVKDDSEACVVFTEQDSSASEVTAAKVMDVIARQPECDGQAAHAVSAYTQDAPRLLKIPNSECPDVWIRLPRHNGQNPGEKLETPVILLEPNFYGHPLAGLLWERQSEEVLLHRKQGLFFYLFMWII